MEISTILLIVVMHYIGDAILQDGKWASTKSYNIKSLLKHTFLYSIIWLPTMWIFTGNLVESVIFTGVTFLIHTATDYITSKPVSKKFKNGEFGSTIPNFGGFSLVMLDQLLHYFQLFITFKILFI